MNIIFEKIDTFECNRTKELIENKIINNENFIYFEPEYLFWVLQILDILLPDRKFIIKDTKPFKKIRWF